MTTAQSLRTTVLDVFGRSRKQKCGHWPFHLLPGTTLDDIRALPAEAKAVKQLEAGR